MKRIAFEKVLMIFLITNGLLAIVFSGYDIYLLNELKNADKNLLESIVSKLYFVNVLIILLVPIGLLITFFVVYKTFYAKMNSINEKLMKIAKGDFSLRIDDSPGLLGRLIFYINEVLEKSGHALKTTKQNIVALNNAADELKKSQTFVVKELKVIEDNSQSVSSAAEELTATSENIVESCKHTLDNTIELSKVVEDGMNNTHTLKETISEIANAIISLNKNITDFIKKYEQIEKFTITINDIADQTNLLALNAAIEAARAGESGRGFAVVADEVRKLSLKTTDSTKEIKTVISGLNLEMKNIGKIIGESVKKIDVGVEATDTTIASFGHINENIKNIVSLMDGVLKSMEEESMAVADISKSVVNISEKLGGLLHSSQEFIKAGDTLKSISQELDHELKEFNIGKVDELITWSSKIETGIKKFDDQHKELVRLLNKFYRAINEGRSKAVLGEILKELANYTVYHFQSEEDAFKRFNFPDKDEHIRIHKDLVNQVVKVIKDFEAGKDVVSVNLLQFLKDWVVKHIMGDDMKYGKYFKQIGAKIN
ncbi:MAG: bacteriohemerythrin [Calditerrivibrio sp.]|nr:bacteriohemerythrin [Calditerrivibrio sp.]